MYQLILRFMPYFYFTTIFDIDKMCFDKMNIRSSGIRHQVGDVIKYCIRQIPLPDFLNNEPL